MNVKILFIGATGYIGGSVLSVLLRQLHQSRQHPDADDVQVTALVRSPEKAIRLGKLELIKTIVGDQSDVALMEKLASEADVIFALADASDRTAIEGMLRGLKARFDERQTAADLIYLSSTTLTADDAKGMFSSSKVYDDASRDDVPNLSFQAFHNNIDRLLLAADGQGYVRTYTIMPPMVFGNVVPGLVARTGAQNATSPLVPYFAQIAESRGRAGMVGEGKNVGEVVDNSELAEFFGILFDAILRQDTTLGHGEEGYYFTTTDEFCWIEMASVVGETLFKAGKIRDPTATSFNEAEIEGLFPGAVLQRAIGANMRTKSSRARALGWKPVKGKKDYLEYVAAEVDAASQRYSTH